MACSSVLLSDSSPVKTGMSSIKCSSSSSVDGLAAFPFPVSRLNESIFFVVLEPVAAGRLFKILAVSVDG